MVKYSGSTFTVNATRSLVVNASTAAPMASKPAASS